jgi:hypothetical protein
VRWRAVEGTAHDRAQLLWPTIASAPDERLAAKRQVIREAGMQELSTGQRILLRVVVVIVILVVLAMFGLIERHPPVVY